MQQVVYPALINFDEPTGLYYLAMYDVGIFVEGDSVEEVFKKASNLLLSYSQVSLQVNGFLIKPTSFEKYKSEHSSNQIVLVKADIKDEFVTKFAKNKNNLYMTIDPFAD